MLTGHKELSLTATSLVEVHERAHESECMSWAYLAAATELSMDAVDNLRQTRRTEPPAEVLELAKDSASQSDDACESALQISMALLTRSNT